MDTPYTPPQDAPTPDLPVHSDLDQKRAHIGPERALLILKLKERNPDVTHQEIADAVGCDRSTVTRTLQIFETNTVPEARKYLKAHSLKAAMVVTDHLEHRDARVQQGAAKAIMAGAGVQEGSAGVQVGVQVIVGDGVTPACENPLRTITVEKAIESES